MFLYILDYNLFPYHPASTQSLRSSWALFIVKNGEFQNKDHKHSNSNMYVTSFQIPQSTKSKIIDLCSKMYTSSKNILKYRNRSKHVITYIHTLVNANAVGGTYFAFCAILTTNA